MFPDGKTVELQQFDGFSAYSFLNAVYLASAAGLLAAVFMQAIARKVVAFINIALSVGSIWLTATKVAAQDLSALSKQLETLTGIAANHGAGDFAVTTTIWPWLAITSLALQGLVLAILLTAQSGWPKRLQKTERRSSGVAEEEAQDSISIWDSQRG